MLRAITESDTPPPAAYRVPWRVDHRLGAHPLVFNDGSTPAEFVRVFISAPSPPGRDAVGPLPSVDTLRWGRMLPGESAEMCLCARDSADAVVTIAWFRPDDGVEYVWRFAP